MRRRWLMETSFSVKVKCVFCGAILTLRLNTIVGKANGIPRCPGCNAVIILDYELEKGDTS